MAEDRSKLAAQRERGARAEGILSDPLVVEAFEAIEREIQLRWRQTQASETEQRENAYAMMRLLENLRSHFAHCVRTGKLAESPLIELDATEAELEARKKVRSGQ